MFLKEVIEGIVVDVEQISERGDFQEGDPISVFPKEYGLDESLYGYYRRGDDNAYEGNFIPIWMYSLFPYCNKTIIYIRPDRTEEDFLNYCGIRPKELADLVLKGEVVPILDNNFDGYREDVFGDFFSLLKKEGKELIRGQLYEDMMMPKKLNKEANKGVFENEVKERAKKYQKYITDLPKGVIEDYNKEHKKGLAPTLENIPHFIAERVCWQELAGHTENVKKIEEGLEGKDPLKAYINARFWHYVVVHDFYARNGIAWMAYEEDEKIKEENVKIALNSTSEIESIEFSYPKSIEDRKTPLRPLYKLIDDYRKEGFVEELKKKGIIKSEEYYKNIPKRYEETVEKLKEVSKSWNETVKSYVEKESKKEIARLHFLHGAMCIPYVNSLKDFILGEGIITHEDLQDLAKSIFYLVKLPKRRKKRDVWAKSMIGGLQALVRQNEKVKNTPFSVINTTMSNPKKLL